MQTQGSRSLMPSYFQIQKSGPPGLFLGSRNPGSQTPPLWGTRSPGAMSCQSHSDCYWPLVLPNLGLPPSQCGEHPPQSQCQVDGPSQHHQTPPLEALDPPQGSLGARVCLSPLCSLVRHFICLQPPPLCPISFAFSCFPPFHLSLLSFWFPAAWINLWASLCWLSVLLSQVFLRVSSLHL